MTPNVGQVPEKKLCTDFRTFRYKLKTTAKQTAKSLVKPAFTEGIHGRTKVAVGALFVV